jgi:predicted aspartyl protease
MGITFIKVKVSNPARPKKKAVHELLVDSGAVYSLLPVKELKKLGIKPVREEVFSLGNGECVTKKVGNALFEFAGKIGAAPIIFGDEGVYLLGVTALEAMGFMLDPLRRELKQAPMLLMPTMPRDQE